MNRTVLVLLALTSTPTLAGAQQQPPVPIQGVDTLALQGIVSRVQAASASSPAEQLADSAARVALEHALANATRIDEVRAAVQQLQELRRTDSLRTVEATVKLYEAGKEVFRDMYMAIGAVNSIHGVLRVEQRLGIATNIWADEDLRNAWDWASDAGMVVGSGLTLLGLTNSSNAVLEDRVTIGLSTIAGTKILSMIFGADKKLNLEEKAKFIELTRIAYDDLRTRADVTHAFIVKNTSFREGLAAFQQRYYAEPDKAAALAELNAYISQFQDVLQQVPEVIGLYRATVTRYTQHIGPEIADGEVEDVALRRQARDLSNAMTRVTEALNYVETEYRDQFLKYISEYASVQGVLASKARGGPAPR